MGFSVGLSAEGQLVISAIYDNSVAAKDGRLQVDDHVLRVMIHFDAFIIVDYLFCFFNFSKTGCQ